MDKKTIFIKTAKGESEGASLSGDLKRIMLLIDNKSTVDEITKRAPPSLREDLHDVLGELVAGEYIRDNARPVAEPKIVAPKITPPKMFVPKPASAPSAELDFTSILTAPPASNAAALAAKQKEEEAARGRADLEAAVAAAKVKANAEAQAKAEAKAKQEVEAAARARAEVEVKAKHEAVIREQAEAKAKQEAAARMQAEQEAARAKAALGAAAKAKADAIEAAARAQQEAEAKAKREAEAARLKAEQDAARIKAELEAAEKAKAEAEAARRKAEEEAARIKAELEAARIRAEAEARAKQEAEEKARQEAEAARLKAEQEAAARARAEAEAQAAAQLKAEQEAARLRAEQEAVHADAEARARHEAEMAAKRDAEEQAKRVAEQEALARAAKESAASTSEPVFKINLDKFLGGAEQPAAPAAVPAAQAHAAAEAQAVQAEEARAATEAKAEAAKKSKQDVAAEMARLKEEADAARRKAEEDARRKAEEQALAEEQANAWAEAEQRAKAQAKIEAEQAAQQAALSQAKSTQKPTPRKHRKALPLGKIAFGLVTLVLVVAIVLPYVYPLQEYIAPLEQRLSAQLKQPVHIGGMSAASFPPKLQLKTVTVGNAQEIKVGSVVLNFELLSLLSEVKVISNAELQDVSIQGNLLDKQAASLKSLGSILQYPVRHLTLQRVKIVTDEVALPILSGIADIDAQGEFSRVSLHSTDDKLGLDLQSNQGRWKLGVNLKESSLPLVPDVVFSDLSAKGDLNDGEVNFTEVDGHLYNGILLGNAKLNWRKGWQLQGHLEAKTFELNKMFPKNGIEGEMFGDATFSLVGARLSQIGDAPRLDGSFTVKNGTVNGFDMVETARLLSREHMVGGRTHFEDMIGTVQLENHTQHYRQLRIISGMLNASGSFDVAPGNQLSGNFNAEIKMRSGNNQLTLFGTLAEPKLRAGR